VRLPGSPSAPFLFAVSDEPEVIAPVSAETTLTEGAIVNSRIAKPGQINRYRVAVEPGQQWLFEVEAAALGTSQLDAIITLYDESGKKLAAGDDGNGVDPVLPFKVPAGVTTLTLAVEDLLGRGGNQFAYRIKGRRQEPDF